MFIRTLWLPVKSLLGCVHRQMWFSSSDLPRWEYRDMGPSNGGCGRLAFRGGDQQPIWGVKFCYTSPVPVTLKVLKRWEEIPKDILL